MVASGDFGKIAKLKTIRTLSNQEKYKLLKEHFVPAPDYMFPSRQHGNTRHFQHSWPAKYPGLVYSVSEDGGFCKYCVLFGKCEASVKELGVLVNRPLINFKKATEKLTEHFYSASKGCSRGKRFHQAAYEEAVTFVSVMDNQSLRIDHQLSSERQKQIAENRLKLQSITETILFCGRQGIALRGYRDDTSAVLENPDSNHGNFLALLQFRVQAGDQVLKEHMSSSSGNALYTSKTIQNELITICGDLIRNSILNDVRRAGFFSVIADEATDTANHEQLAISIRFVKNCQPCERFIGFHRCVTGVSGQALADDILEMLAEWQLQPHLLRGQAYDGAGAMAGKTKGAASRIKEKYPKALYTHCAAHRLNLCVMKCCSIREVNNMMQSADSVSRFFDNSPKRQLALDKSIEEEMPTEKRKKTKEMCKTRWVERHESFEVFIDLYKPTFRCLEVIASSPTDAWNRQTRSDGHSLLLSMSQFSFIVALVLAQKVLSYTKGLSIKLQGRYVDVVRAYRDIELVKKTLKTSRSDIDAFHARIYEEVLAIAESVDIQESAPRFANCSRQQHRSNPPADNTSEYYKRTLTISMLDHLISELDSRFGEDSTLIVTEFMAILPSEITNPNANLELQNFSNLIQLYENDLPSPRCLDTELDIWKTKWLGNIELAKELDTPEKCLKEVDDDYFPNISILIKLMATLPVTSCECERSISMLRLIKTPMRSTMTEERLNGLALMQYHRDVVIDPKAIVEEFSIRHPRRLLLSDAST